MTARATAENNPSALSLSKGASPGGKTGFDASTSSALSPNGISVPDIDGKITRDSSLADFIWFRTGGPAQWLVQPAGVEALSAFLADLDSEVPVLPVGVGSNLIVRDGGVPGVVIRLPKAMGQVTAEPDNLVRAGGAAMGIKVASTARDAGIAGLEFLSGIPGTAGGAVRMNAGCYGRETSDILVECTLVTRSGAVETWPAERLAYSYRHSELPEGAVVVEALFRGEPGDPAAIGAEMKRIAEERAAAQPTGQRTGGSTFKNPPDTSAWKLVDEAGCRGLRIGGAQVSEKHTNFLINTGGASAADIEALGEEVRRRVRGHSGVDLHWEIQRVGVSA